MMNSLLDVEVSKDVKIDLAHECLILKASATISADDSDDEEMTVVQPMTIHISLPFSMIATGEKQMTEDLLFSIDKTVGTKFFLSGMAKLKDAIMVRVMKLDLVKYAAMHIPNPESETAH